MEIKDFAVTLNQIKNERMCSTVTARLEKGLLWIEGLEFGPYVESFWGDEKHEYSYSLNYEDTAYLFELIKDYGTPKGVFFARFGGENACEKFAEFCRANGLKVKYTSV